METKSTVIFIGEKVNKIRWKPSDLQESNIFLSGSWDASTNHLKLWKYDSGDDSISNLHKLAVPADVNEIRFIGNNEFVTGLDNGQVDLFSITEKSEIESRIKWSNIHYFSNDEQCACTCIDINEQNIVTAGEDGRVNFLSLNSDKPIFQKNDADSCSINAISFTKHREVITGNNRGQMKLLDLNSAESVKSFRISDTDDNYAATCITRHPTHTHMVLIGSEKGTISVWDLRQTSTELNILEAHNGPVMEMKFHPSYPQQLFTCSMAGELWHWHQKKPTNTSTNTLFVQKSLQNLEDNSKLWFMNRNSFDKIEVNPLMSPLHLPINSLDISKHRLVCGADNEGVNLINNLPLMFL